MDQDEGGAGAEYSDVALNVGFNPPPAPVEERVAPGEVDMELGTKRDEARIVIIGGADAQCVESILGGAGLKPTCYGTVNEALRKRCLRDAGLVIIGPTTVALRPAAACWRMRMAGCQSRILLLLVETLELV